MKIKRTTGDALSVEQRAHFDKVWLELAKEITIKNPSLPEPKLLPVFGRAAAAKKAAKQVTDWRLKEQLIQEESFVMRLECRIPVTGKTTLHTIILQLNRSIQYQLLPVAGTLFPDRDQAYTFAFEQGVAWLKLGLLRAFDAAKFTTTLKKKNIPYQVDMSRFFEFGEKEPVMPPDAPPVQIEKRVRKRRPYAAANHKDHRFGYLQ
ncbi:hypothetical protein ACTJJ0_30895 [Chitinophaga sp. 22321]|uniref:Uncharacterized protein n=1 Tax=Chitinophaga hostae TaxID=2831022 RepID=A0ABS5J8P7_9BACT|nr:hypothetical protein [Chitinophaga hostae]MBS0031595.1 hypothetical protein [Chitinophaga hostae]